MRKFASGATRGSDEGKIDPEAALSPLVLTAYCEYIRSHRVDGPGGTQEDDNWQLGIPTTSYMKSLLRHVLEAWRAYRTNEPMIDSLFGVWFNTNGLLHELLKKEKMDNDYANDDGWYDVETGFPVKYDLAKPALQPLLPHQKLEYLETKLASSQQPVVLPDDWPIRE